MKLESTLRDNAAMLYAAPILDAMLLILIFFLLSSSLVLRSGIPVDIPKSASSLPPAEASHVITVLRGTSPQIYFNEKEIQLDDLADELDQASSEARYVIIRADREAAFGAIIDISNIVLDKGRGLELAYATKSDR